MIGGGRVQRIVMAGHGQQQIVEIGRLRGLAVAQQHVEARHAAFEIDVEQPHVGLRIFAIGDDAAILDLADELLHGRMIETHHREAVEGNVLDEGAESVLDRVERMEMVEMLRVDVGDDGDVGRKLQEGAVALVGLDHHPVAGAEARIGAIGVDDAAIDDGRIESAGVEQRRDERGRRGLAMRAGDGDALLEAHQLGEHFRAAHHGQALVARGDEFGIVALDRGRDDDDGGLAEIFGVMADEDARAFFARRFTLAFSDASEPCTL